MAPKKWTTSSANTAAGGGASGLRNKVTQMISENNLLGLPDSEVKNMAEILLKCETRKELFEWCTGTLMLAESNAAEIVKQREDLGMLFPGDPNPGKSSSGGGGSAAPASSTKSQKSNTSNAVTAANLEAVGGAAGGDDDTSSEHPSLASLVAPSSNRSGGGSGGQTNSSGSSGGKKGGKAGKGKRGAAPMQSELDADDTASVATTSLTSMTSMSSTAAKKTGKGKKGVPLAQTGPGTLVKGVEMECGCFASQHAFKGNCLNCGRIFCEQEGMDICYSCGLDPNRCIQYEVKVETGNIDTATQTKNASMYKAALERRDQLLQYARERTKRTQIIDDQAGMYSTSAWLSAKEREEAKKADNEQRKKVADLHKASGAYQVHLDIVNQSVHLGATTMKNQAGGNTGESDSDDDGGDKKKDGGDDEFRKIEHEKIIAQQAAVKKAAATAGGVVASTTYHDPNAVEEEDEEEDDDDEEVPHLGEEEAEGDLRVLPLPSLLQKVWYSEGDEDSTTLAQRAKEDQLRQKQNKIETKEQKEAAAKSRDRIHNSKGQSKKKVSEVVSLRVQNDYYEEDQTEFSVQNQLAGLETKQLEFNKQVIASATAKSFGQMAEDQYALQLRKEAGEQLMKELVEKEALEQRQGGASSNSTTAGAVSSSTTAGGGAEPSLTIEKPNEPLYRIPASWRGKDEGMCLTMHQPYAGLLVAGIKTHEGRGWPTNFRGRLWIHAAAAKPQDVEGVEAHARQYVPEGTKFPTHYPTSCLLGYTYVVDCLKQEDYKKKFPLEEQSSDSPYVFICLGSKSLSMMLQMEGDHKLFKLDKKLWHAAKAQLGEKR